MYRESYRHVGGLFVRIWKKIDHVIRHHTASHSTYNLSAHWSLWILINCHVPATIAPKGGMALRRSSRFKLYPMHLTSKDNSELIHTSSHEPIHKKYEKCHFFVMCIPSRMDFPSWFVFCKHFAGVVGFDRTRLGKLTECVWEAKRAKQWIQLFRIPNDSSNVYWSLQRCHESNTLILPHPMQNFKTIVQLRNKILANEISWEFGY